MAAEAYPAEAETLVPVPLMVSASGLMPWLKASSPVVTALPQMTVNTAPSATVTSNAVMP